MSASSILVVVFMFACTAQARGESAIIANSNFGAFHFFNVTARLALAIILGPFGVHLLKFTPDTNSGSLTQYLGLLEFPVEICDPLPITTHTRRT